MSIIYFTLSLDPEKNTIADTNLPIEQQQAYIDSFAILLKDPTDASSVMSVFEIYYLSQITLDSSNISLIAPTRNPTINTVTQLDMDGNIVISNNQPTFSTTKEDSKELLGSVEKISSTNILIADAVNKRAIIVNTLTNRVVWEYLSDRYIIDAHLIPQDPTTININQSNCASSDVIVNNGEIVIWENSTDSPITVYSGDISGIDTTNLDVNLYGQDFESITLETGDRWSFRFNGIGDFSWFSYPNLYTGKIIVSNEYTSGNNQFIILESDSLESTYSSKVKKIDAWGNVLAEFEGMVKPRDARPQLNNKVLIST